MILLRRFVLVLSALLVLWASFLLWSSGVVLKLGPIQISSRNPRNVLLLAAIGAAAVWALSTPRRAGPMTDEWRWWGRQTVVLHHWIHRFVRPLAPFLSVAIAVIGIAVDIHQWAGPPPLWLDEEMIALNIRDRSFTDLAGPLWLGQSAPLAWLALQRVFILTLGTSEVTLRLGPLLFGITTVAAAVWVGARWLNRPGAAALVLLCWVGPFISHYRFEVKHYTADAFWGLLLPALAVWVLEGADVTHRRRRALIWWIAAAVGQFFANGGLLAAPPCAIALLVLLWRRDGLRAAFIFASYGAIWLVAFAFHYQLSIRYTHESPFLRGFWRSHLPPDSIGVIATIRWLVGRVPLVAFNPGGTELWASLWLLAIAGFAFGVSRPLGGVFATLPLFAFVYSAAGLVPMSERMALWIVPALYTGVALAVDRAYRVWRDATSRRNWLHVAAATLVLLGALDLCRDFWHDGLEHRKAERPRHSKHRLNDALAVRWLMQHVHPGDAIVATRLTWPAIWWYGPIPIGDGSRPGRSHVDAAAMYEVSHQGPGPDCTPRRLESTLGAHRRVLLYLGFRDQREGFDDLLLRELDEIASLTAASDFSDLSRAAVFEPGSTNADTVKLDQLRARDAPPPLEGCIRIRPAARW